jgi:hypothetical protein
MSLLFLTLAKSERFCNLFVEGKIGLIAGIKKKKNSKKF